MATAKALLYGPALVASPGPTTLFTPPATELDVIHLIHVSNPTAAAISLTISIGADAVGTRIVGTNTTANIPANAVTQFVGPFVVPPSTAVTASAGAAGLNISFHGERRTLG